MRGGVEYMTLWMRSHARGLSGESAPSDPRAWRTRRFGLGVLSFQAVGKRRLEDDGLTLAIALHHSGQRRSGGGGAAGLPWPMVALAIYARQEDNVGVFFTESEG